MPARYYKKRHIRQI